MITINRITRAGATLAAAVTLVFAGCSAGDVELNGSVFDTLGVGSKSQSASSNMKVPQRQALVVPPNLERLPEPGSGTNDEQLVTSAMPVNPEQRRVAAASKAEQEHRQYCEKAMQTAKINRDFREVKGPLGRCDTTILDSVNVKSPVGFNSGGSSAPDPKLPR